MKFDVNRLSRLAGLEGSTSLNEAANRSYHDDPALDKETEVVHGKGQLSEAGHEKEEAAHKMGELSDMDEMHHGDHGDMDEMDMKDMEEGSYMKEMQLSDEQVDMLVKVNELSDMEEMQDMEEERGGKKGDRSHARDYEKDEMMYRSDEMVQLDEEIIRKELIEMRKEKLQETALRRAIRSEIRDVVKDLDVYASSNWLYGEDKPQRSREGYTTMGAPGIGFKGFKG